MEEIEQSMQRDIALTSLVSLLCVTGLFWLGFRRLFPLIGIAVLLGLMAVAAMAAGALYFNKLNIIAVSFCSILFGLGDDFSLLLFQRFYQCRNAGNDRETAIANSIDHCAPGFSGSRSRPALASLRFASAVPAVSPNWGSWWLWEFGYAPC